MAHASKKHPPWTKLTSPVDSNCLQFQLLVVTRHHHCIFPVTLSPNVEAVIEVTRVVVKRSLLP
jgi:hypothetical protein